MKEMIGYVLSALVVVSMWSGIWWTGLVVYVKATDTGELPLVGLLAWAAVSLALTTLLMVATVKWGA